jgi:hypothetical protein
MHATQPRFWDIAYAAVLLIAIPVAIFHAAQGRWAQAILVTLAAAVGAFILVTGWNRAETVPAATEDTGQRTGKSEPVHASKVDIEQRRESSGRYVGWIPMGAISGFVATGIMTAAVLLAYGASALLASEASGANQLQVWLAALIDNTVTEIATFNLALAIGIHLVAGIGWAIIYTGFIEPRVSGSGLQRGVKFGLIPWLLSITVFFPVVGAGFFAADIGAGPLPILGNLILHLIYGAALGKIYASHAVWQEPGAEVSQYNLKALEGAHRSMALALIPGALLGLILGVVASSIFVSDGDLLMAAVLGAVVGSAAGVWIGSIAGLSPDVTDSGDNATA